MDSIIFIHTHHTHQGRNCMYLIVHRQDGKREVITRERDWFMTKQAKDYYEGFLGRGHVFIDFIK